MFALDFDSLGAVIVTTAAIVGAIVAIFRVFGTYILAPYARKQDHKDDDRLDLKLRPLSEELTTIRQEVTWNHGTSLKDAVRNLDHRVTRFEGRFDEHDRYFRDQKAKGND
jgi:hypothetical protein